MTTGTRDIESTIRSMSPQALAIFKQNLKIDSLNPTVRQRLEVMPEMADVFQGGATKATKTAKPWEYTADMNVWQKALKTFTMPFDIVGRYVTEPFGTIVTSPFTKDVAGTEGMSWYDRERASYETLNPWLKFGIESLPWLMIPGAGAVGTGAKAGTGVAGALGRLGSVGAKVGKAVEFSPWGLTEKATGTVLKGAGKAIGIKPKVVTPKAVDPVAQKLTGLIEKFKPDINEQKQLLHEFRTKQASAVNKYLQTGANPDTAFQLAAKEMKGKASTVPVGAFQSMTSDEVRHLKQMIIDHPAWTPASGQALNKIPTENALMNLLTGQKLPTKYERELLEEVYGQGMVTALLHKRSMGEKAMQLTLDLAGIPKALVSSFDMSFPLRQGIGLIGEKSWWTSWKPMLKVVLSDDNMLAVSDTIIKNKNYALLKRLGLELTDVAGAKVSGTLAKAEESFPSRIANSFPWVKASNRAYTTFGNKLRADTMYSYIEKWQASGMTTDEIVATGTKVADFINKATGRGNLGKLKGAAEVLNAVTFSPKFVASRFQTPLAVFTKDPIARKMIAKNLAVFLGGGITALTLAKMTGAEVELDPRSTDFGKIKIGNTRIDFWGGYQPLARYTAQFLTETRKTASGATQDVSKLETIGRFAESKLSPTAGLILSALRGSNFIGQPVGETDEDIGKTVLNNVTPMFIQDLLSASMDEGLLGTGLATLSGFGASVNTYPVGNNYDIGNVPVLGGIAPIAEGLSTPDPRETQSKIRFGKSYAELSPAQKGQIRNDPAVRASLTPTANEQKVYALYDQQTEDDKAFTQGLLSGSDWRERMYDRLAERSWMQSQYEGTPPTPETPLEEAVSEYYSFFRNLGDNPLPNELNQAMQQADSFIQALPQEYQDYIEDNRYPDATPMMQEFKAIQAKLRPYWNITNQVWSQYSPELKAVSDQLDILQTRDERAYKIELRKYPQIVRAREQIARQKLIYKRQHPEVGEYLRLFYSY